MKIGLLGGTFDPLHKGHLHLLETALAETALDAVVLMPAGMPYHKAGPVVTPAAYRFEIARRSLKKSPDILLSDMEIRRNKPTYTLDTLNSLEALLPDTERFYLIYGSDILFTIENWYRPAELLRRVVILAAMRPGDDPEKIRLAAETLRLRYGADIRILQGKQKAVSSTLLRQAILRENRELYEERRALVERSLAACYDGEERRKILARKIEMLTNAGALAGPEAREGATGKTRGPLPSENWRAWVADKAADFIAQNQIYIKEDLLLALRPETLRQLYEAESLLFSLIGLKRLIHSWNVTFCALELALRFGEDPDRTALAALLHDAAKELSLDEMTALVPKRVSEEFRGPALIHGPAGAALATKLFGIDDPDILSSIRYHTTLHDNASRMEKIIFLADKIEPGRKYGDLEPIREQAKTHLDTATWLCLKGVEKFLLREKLKPHPLSVAATLSLSSALAADSQAPDAAQGACVAAAAPRIYNEANDKAGETCERSERLPKENDMTADSRSGETASPVEAKALEKMTRVVEDALNSHKGRDVCVIDVREKTVLADYFILASAGSEPHVKALADYVCEAMEKDFGLSPAHIEGYESARWILLDYLDFVVHIFHEEDREFYSLEKLWTVRRAASAQRETAVQHSRGVEHEQRH